MPTIILHGIKVWPVTAQERQSTGAQNKKRLEFNVFAWTSVLGDERTNIVTSNSIMVSATRKKKKKKKTPPISNTKKKKKRHHHRNINMRLISRK